MAKKESAKKASAKKQIDIKDITSSPYFVAALMGICIALTIAALVFFILDINKTKKDITAARQLNVACENDANILGKLKEESDQASARLEECESILPQSLGNAYELQEDVTYKFESFGASVTAIEFITTKNETNEIVFTITCSGSFESIYNVMNYYSNIEQVHRIDSLNLTKDSEGIYSAVITLAILSEEPVDGVVAGLGDTAA